MIDVLVWKIELDVGNSPATVDKISPWIEGLIVLVVVYICAITVLARRRTEPQKTEKSLTDGR